VVKDRSIFLERRRKAVADQSSEKKGPKRAIEVKKKDFGWQRTHDQEHRNLPIYLARGLSVSPCGGVTLYFQAGKNSWGVNDGLQGCMADRDRYKALKTYGQGYNNKGVAYSSFRRHLGCENGSSMLASINVSTQRGVFRPHRVLLSMSIQNDGPAPSLSRGENTSPGKGPKYWVQQGTCPTSRNAN